MYQNYCVTQGLEATDGFYDYFGRVTDESIGNVQADILDLRTRTSLQHKMWMQSLVKAILHLSNRSRH